MLCLRRFVVTLLDPPTLLLVSLKFSLCFVSFLCCFGCANLLTRAGACCFQTLSPTRLSLVRAIHAWLLVLRLVALP